MSSLNVITHRNPCSGYDLSWSLPHFHNDLTNNWF